MVFLLVKYIVFSDFVPISPVLVHISLLLNCPFLKFPISFLFFCSTPIWLSRWLDCHGTSTCSRLALQEAKWLLQLFVGCCLTGSRCFFRCDTFGKLIYQVTRVRIVLIVCFMAGSLITTNGYQYLMAWRLGLKYFDGLVQLGNTFE